jgi:hypothetical protein
MQSSPGLAARKAATIFIYERIIMAVKATVKEQVETIKNGAKYQAVKTHVKKNQKFYVGFGAGALVVLVTRKSTINVVNAPVFNNIVNNGGHMRKIIHCLETDELWPSVGVAAEAAGTTIQNMSRHVNGHRESLNGLHYVIEALASG